MISKCVRFTVLLAAWLAVAQAAGAGKLIELEVSDENGVYTIRVDMMVHAAPQHVYDILTDYAHIHRLNPSITESERLPAPKNGPVRVRTRIEDCVFIFCVDFVRVETVREVQPGHILAEIEPQSSDFDYGRAVWRVLELDDHSRVLYEARLQPGFALQPVIGPYVMKRKLRAGVLASFRNLECIARLNTARVTGSLVLDADAGMSNQRCPG